MALGCYDLNDHANIHAATTATTATTTAADNNNTATLRRIIKYRSGIEMRRLMDWLS